MIAYEQGPKAILLLADGRKFEGYAIGKAGITTGEICFNTGMTGYQEIFTDPSYAGQVITMTNAHIGNYGAASNENQSGKVQINGLIVKNFSEFFSRKLATYSLQDFLEENGIIGISNIDTRALVRHIRSKGAMNCIISSTEMDENKLKALLKEVPSMDGCELASAVSTPESYFAGETDAPFRVAVMDYGCKQNILDSLAARGCYMKVFPARTDFSEVQAWNPDGYFLSNGPGDPAAMDYAIETSKEILNSGKPVFGICLGHQLLALAEGMQTEKLKYGHRGINHPVLNVNTGLGEITSQNHGFGVVRSSIDAFESEVQASHINLNDHSVEGLKWLNKPVFSVQYHPESSPGPYDSRYLFDDFVELIRAYSNKEEEVSV